MRILGIDPGIEITGYGLIEAASGHIKLIRTGTIKTDRRRRLGERLKKIYKELTEIIGQYRPKILVLERPYSHYRHPTTTIVMGCVRGIIYLASSQNNIPIEDFPPTRIKKAISGRGDASKEQVQKMVGYLLNLKEPPGQEDVADALAISITYAHINRL
jgi:crossover junction endodeoxyribonuclease RuvC